MNKMLRFASCASLVAILGTALPSLAETITFMGKAYCSNRADVALPIPAMPRLRLVSAPLYVGQHVQKGEKLITYELPLETVIEEKQTLAKGRPDELELELTKINLQLAQMRQKQALAEKMVADQSLAPNVLVGGIQAINALEHRLNSVRDKLKLAKDRHNIDIDYSKLYYGDSIVENNKSRTGYLYAPIEGTVLSINTDMVPGTLITSSTTAVTLGQMDPIVVHALVYEQDIKKIHINDKADVTFPSIKNKTFVGTISLIDTMPQPATYQQPSFYMVYLTIANPNSVIKEGLRADITLTGNAPNGQ